MEQCNGCNDNFRANLSLLKKKIRRKKAHSDSNANCIKTSFRRWDIRRADSERQGEGNAVEPKACRAPTTEGESRYKWVLRWRCKICAFSKEGCIPIRSESRCLCGHRLKQHAKINNGEPPRCLHPGCKCCGFFYIFAEGSFSLRCRCKHKATDHNPRSSRHECTRRGLRLQEF